MLSQKVISAKFQEALALIDSEYWREEREKGKLYLKLLKGALDVRLLRMLKNDTKLLLQLFYMDLSLPH